MTEPPAEPLADAMHLTRRELQCLRHAAEGMTIAATAEAMAITERTVEFHLGNAQRKLKAPNKLRTVVIALQQGLIDP